MKFRKLKFKIIAAAMLFTAILGAAFIRIVPDYSTSRGFAVVSLSDYDKYKQGYCLKEDRILPKEELYKRAILDFLEKGKIILYTMRSNDCKKFKGIKECRDIYNKMLKAQDKLKVSKGAFNYDFTDEKQIHSPFPNFREEIS